jgi:hypothetical protein
MKMVKGKRPQKSQDTEQDTGSHAAERQGACQEWSGYIQLRGRDTGSSRRVKIHAMEGST